jgi:predicted RNase H-like HicB family nuclease
MKLGIVIEPGADGYYVANCPALKGCWSQGKTAAEAVTNIREAIELYLEPPPGSLEEKKGRQLVEIEV